MALEEDGGTEALSPYFVLAYHQDRLFHSFVHHALLLQSTEYCDTPGPQSAASWSWIEISTPLSTKKINPPFYLKGWLST